MQNATFGGLSIKCRFAMVRSRNLQKRGSGKSFSKTLQDKDGCRGAMGDSSLQGDRLRREPERGLTAKEQEVAAWVARGLRNAEIGQRLGVTENTVKVHLRRIYQKLNCRNRAELAV
ncbi:MAG: helix-turn-helix transcriptional regulator, partial [Nitrospirae bacterium]|nr:helix-turn-helix transcriptional regulator [Nitrospirota bacterium]